MKNNHCVFYRTDLKYDGRVCAIIRSLAQSFPDDKILLYEFTIHEEYFDGFSSNVSIKKSKLFLNRFKRSYILQLLKNFEYGIRSFLFLLKKKPKSIQVHHEVTILGPLIYKLLFKNTIIVYDDKELYHIKDKNIPKFLYFLEYQLIKSSDLVIITNKYRKKALQFIHNHNLKESIIVDNYVFEPNKKDVSANLLSQIDKIHESNKKVLIHQGVLTKSRGTDLLYAIIENLPENWILGFIGISNQVFNNFTSNLDFHSKSMLHNFGYVDYSELDSFYQYIDAGALFYISNTFNNKYCAPNRLYSAVNKGKPIIVNEDNVTLNNFISEYGNGLAISNKNKIKLFFDNFNIFNNKAKLLTGKYEFPSSIPQLKDYYSQK